jgi:glycosyltransferase involved in cell wall biosynthesis
MMNDNKGTYITTNTLIGLTKHENIIRFDSDDIMTPNLVKELVKDKGSSDIVLLGYLDFEDNIIGKKLAVAGIIYFKKSVMDIAGGYQPWRCAADTELISRLANKVKISQLKKAVFYRRIHENSLTRRDDTKHDSEIRNYYTSLIKRNYSDNEIKIERVVNTYLKDYKLKNEKLISVNMATYPARKKSFLKCINRLLEIDIIDIIRIYLNEYENIPNDYPKSQKIIYLIGEKNLKDTGKFYWASKKHNEYYFTVDDDILYTKSFFVNHIKILKQYNNKIFVTLHGKIMADNPKHINDCKKHYHFLNNNNENVWVNNGGTGVMLFDNNIYSLNLDMFKYDGMCDLWIASYCQNYKIPIICRKHNQELISLENNDTLYDNRKKFVTEHQEIFDSLNKWILYKHDKKISIVTSYYNRKDLFYQTLKSITKSSYSNFELIVVDDGSDTNHRLEDLSPEFPFMKIIRIEKNDKWYVNPCIPFNIGIKSVVGDIIILQNPECYHINDILTYAYENIDNSNYLSISTYALSKNLTTDFIISNNKHDFFKILPQHEFNSEKLLGWYNHSKYRPVYYHFCSIITKDNMNLLGGFDERFANGIAFDDDEFLERIIKLKLDKKICDDVSVIHLYHDSVYYNKTNYLYYHKENESKFKITKNQNIINVNNNLPIIKDNHIPKRIFFYWCGDNFSWMRYMTLYSFRKMNPDWEMIIYKSNNSNRHKTWDSFEKQDFSKNIKNNYFNKLHELNIKILPVEFPEDIKPIIKDISLIHESDLFRYYELYTNGGIYCDTDVLFFRPIDDLYNTLIENNHNTIFAQSKWVTIGFLGSVKNNELYKDLFDFGIYNYKNKIKTEKYDINSYQSMGAELIYKKFNKSNWKKGSIDSDVLTEIIKIYPYLNIYNLPDSIIYHYDWETPKIVYSNPYGIDTFDLDSIGYHWFGGSDESNKYSEILNENNFNDYKTTFSELSKLIIKNEKI